jgi:predicted ABC-type transport system involved in lysophospholipase L1 biosynthesis ATPase subunit
MSEPTSFLVERVPQASFRALLAARGVRKAFQMGETELEVLHGVDLELRRGERLALMGPSGAGKSTLLHTLGLLDRPSAGEVIVEGESAWELSTTERARLRNQRIGFVFQFYHLIPELTALENVLLPAMIASGPESYRARPAAHTARARETLTRFGLEQRLGHRPPQLSGGERQRVALARALQHDPPILIADEPTGNLDRTTGERVLDLLFAEQERRSLSLLLVTHDERLAARCGRVLEMEDGRIRTEPGRGPGA